MTKNSWMENTNMMIQRKTATLLILILLLALLAGAVPAAMAENTFKAVVTADSMPVYSQVESHDYLGSLPRGAEVTVEAYSGNVALISYRGYYGLAKVSDMKAVAEPAAVQNTAVQSETVQSRPVIAVRATRIYKKPSTRSRYISVEAGTSMTLLAVSGNCAKVERGGVVGYAVYSHLGEPGSALQTTETAPATQAETTEAAQTAEVKTGSAPVVTTCSTRIYRKASTSSAYVTVDKGTKLTLVAVSGNCAKVQRGSAVGYTKLDCLASDTSGGESAASTADTKVSSSFSSGSTEYVIYKFLVGEMGLNRAAAMGVLANIKYESAYKPTINGDGGTSYGLCQWHLGRKTNLINWCKQNDLDYTTVEGQLRFLQYELSTSYPGVLSYLKKVDNTAEGAYDAAYYFCFNFEAPAARTSQSKARGNYAKNTLFKL